MHPELAIAVIIVSGVMVALILAFLGHFDIDADL